MALFCILELTSSHPRFRWWLVCGVSPGLKGLLTLYEGMLLQEGQGWGLLSQFPPFCYFTIFQHHQYTCWLLNITFIFDRCHCSLPAMTPAKYGCDAKNLNRYFGRTENFAYGENNEWSLSNPHSWNCHCLEPAASGHGAYVGTRNLQP